MSDYWEDGPVGESIARSMTTPPTPPRAGQVWEGGDVRRSVERTNERAVGWRGEMGDYHVSFMETWLAWSRTARLVKDSQC